MNSVPDAMEMKDSDGDGASVLLLVRITSPTVLPATTC